MIRNVLGSLLGLIGAAVAVWSPFRVWYEGRHGRDYRLADLFSSAGVTDARGALLASFVMPFVLAALLTLTAILLRSRLLMALAGVVVIGFAVLWMVRQGQAAGSLSVGGDGGGLGDGVANAFGGGALLILAAFVMRGRPARRRPRDLPATDAPYPPNTSYPQGDPYPPPASHPQGDPYPQGGSYPPDASYPPAPDRPQGSYPPGSDTAYPPPSGPADPATEPWHRPPPTREQP
ncbi:hypothetical protein OHA84_20870 [Streptomyces sp. NBC_00513]|uniref:hypothetical protein n=1 Tax=unclassified Streptomyces TaxID=2593676 RepID=UPI0022539E08|nr:hypothetical protein [Streptomyces sp. NBC_00424]MCX5074032.1 hypothetical protein [Streptomyces sp. NBC_00424]WUD42759.1 hypothetical protein OHA84_20870 [Streptomyces sp. NBC_00513]